MNQGINISCVYRTVKGIKSICSFSIRLIILEQEDNETTYNNVNNMNKRWRRKSVKEM